MPVAAVVFDLDGTLVDSAADIAEAVNRLFDALALPRVAAALVRGWIGDGVAALVASALAHHGSAVPLGQALPVFMAGYHDCLLRSPQLYPGVVEALQCLRQADVPMAICTNKPVELVPPLPFIADSTYNSGWSPTASGSASRTPTSTWRVSPS